MHDSSGEQYNAAAVIGGGLIGASWTAVFLSHGLRVTVHDPRPDIEAVVCAGLRAVAPSLKELGMEVASLVEDTGALMFEARGLNSSSSCGRRSRRRPSQTRCSPARAPRFPPPPSLSVCASPSV
jgi:2-polyprenyl-6-methoxyphenol hydroxylase-like FAD-dependent oxidoreductase